MSYGSNCMQSWHIAKVRHYPSRGGYNCFWCILPSWVSVWCQSLFHRNVFMPESGEIWPKTQGCFDRAGVVRGLWCVVWATGHLWHWTLREWCVEHKRIAHWYVQSPCIIRWIKCRVLQSKQFKFSLGPFDRISQNKWCYFCCVVSLCLLGRLPRAYPASLFCQKTCSPGWACAMADQCEKHVTHQNLKIPVDLTEWITEIWMNLHEKK